MLDAGVALFVGGVLSLMVSLTWLQSERVVQAMLFMAIIPFDSDSRY